MPHSYTPAELLKKHHLSTTQVRLKVLHTLINRESALSQTEIENILDKTENRVTVYRVLKDLEQAGVIHRIGSPAGKVMFALCHETCAEGHHHDEHVHFSCTSCEKVYCLETRVHSAFSLPEGFQTFSVQVVAEGICKDCQKLPAK